MPNPLRQSPPPVAPPSEIDALRADVTAFADHVAVMTSYVRELYDVILAQQQTINTLLTVTGALQQASDVRRNENAAIVTMIAGLAASKGARG